MIKVQNLVLKAAGKVIVENLTFEVGKGSFSCLTGPSGCGKTTVINALTGFHPVETGSIEIAGLPLDANNIESIRAMTAYIPQEIKFRNMLVSELVFSLFSFKKNASQKPALPVVKDLLSVFGLDPSILDKELKVISGGEKQRVLLAIAILLQKQLLILDEPASGLDHATSMKVLDYISAPGSFTVLASSHNKDWIQRCNQQIELNHHGTSR